jgi:hypothetical protein
VVYLNGQEIGRGNLPQGKIAPDTLADDYAGDALVPERVGGAGRAGRGPAAGPSARQRQLALQIPAASVRRGVNVLAVEIHRSPAPAAMFLNAPAGRVGYEQRGGWWNRCALDDLRLTAPGGKGVTPNNQRPKGYQVWGHVPFKDVDYRTWGDPEERIAPLRMGGARNGAFAAELVVSSTDPVRGLRVAVTDLKGSSGGSIAAGQVQVRYPQPGPDHWAPTGPSLTFDDLGGEPPPTLAALKVRVLPAPVMQPVWITINVPRGIPAGTYTGKVTVTADGQNAIEVPLELQLADWDLPDPSAFTTFMNIVESPDSVALQYNVAPWSEAHWKLLDEDLRLVGLIGAKQVYIPVIRRTHFGNAEGMVRWVRQADGALQPDCAIVEKYLDLAIKHLGKVPVVCCNIADTTPDHRQGMLYSELDPRTGEVKDAVGPAWGTPESQDMLRKLLAALKGILAKRGMEEALMVGMNAGDGAAGPQAPPKEIADIRAVSPQTRWCRVSHYWLKGGDDKPNQPKYGSIALVGGVMGVYWDPDVDKPFYGWRNPNIVVVYPRTANMQATRDNTGTRMAQDSDLPQYRVFAEAVMLSGRRRALSGNSLRGDWASELGADFTGLRGIGPFGADFWPVLKGGGQGGGKTILGRYGESYADGGWGTVSLSQVVQSLLAPGKDGPASTVRLEMMREALQEAEARVFVQNVLLDPARRGRLPAALAARAEATCKERTQALRYASEFWEEGIIDPLRWQAQSLALYQLAGEVGKALGK